MVMKMLCLATCNRSTGMEEHFEIDLKKGNNLKVFKYSSVMTATNGFSSENKLGQGGYGPVYKGILPTGREVAVKRLSQTSGQGILEFKNELTLISANDSLKPGDILNSTSELSSKNNKFSLYFGLQRDEENYDLTIDMSLKARYAVEIVVLMSDRNQPALGLDNSTVLSLNHSGVLKIESQHMKPIIIYSPPQPINKTMASLLNTGNFLGVNHKTGHHWLLCSRLTSSVDALGAFSLEWEPTEQELMIRRREKVCWRSGKLRNNRFEHILEDAQRTLKYIVVSNEDEDSFSFTTDGKNKYWRISYNGQLSDDKGDVARADLCFGYNNTDGGCQRWMDIPKIDGIGNKYNLCPQ
ncbi:hypothetical protein Fmac_025160 [Flemingia macrophylla]|uniref:Protein kinase domain-containing protein n=1 Tax=Flemingia macrophylla TaxID=520843 RepID=A0ABD1LRE8_9FABA